MGELQERDRGAAAVLVVDVQNDFCDVEGAVSLSGDDVRPLQEVVPRIVDLVNEARQARVPVIFVRTEHGEWTDSRVWLSRYRTRPRARTTCVVGSWGAEFYGVEPTDIDLVVTKNRYSAFIGTNLDLVLRSRGINTLLICGVLTNVCVESTLRDGFMLGYETIMVEDCSASTSAEAHEATIRNVRRHFGASTTAAEALAQVAGAVPALVAAG